MAEGGWCMAPGSEQAVFEAVATAAQPMLADERAALRAWASGEMRERPWRVWRSVAPGRYELRLSFHRALAIAATDVVAGRTPA